MATILIVEDDPLIALNLSDILARATGAEVRVATSLAGAEKYLAENLHFALLDVNLRNDTTYALARRLASTGVPFAFASGSSRASIPDDLEAAPFLVKPYRSQALITMVSAALKKSALRPCGDQGA